MRDEPSDWSRGGDGDGNHGGCSSSVRSIREGVREPFAIHITFEVVDGVGSLDKILPSKK